MSRCLVPDCSSEIIHLRGLCRSCYNYASSLVRHHITSWESLEAAGCVDHATGQIQSPKRPVRIGWFAKATTLTPDAMADELRLRSALNLKRKKKGSR